MTPRRRAVNPRDDRGYTLAEVLVSTGVMSVVMAIVMAGIVQMYRSLNASMAIADMQSQLNTAFLRLDREIRYASGLATPRTVGPDKFVEYLNTNTDEPRCTQLELNAADGTLRRREWAKSTTPSGSWTVLASRVDVARSSFEPTAEDTARATDSEFQLLHLTLVVTPRNLGDRGSATTKVTFTALNAGSKSANPDAVCPEAR